MIRDGMNLQGVIGVNWRDVPAKEICPGIRKRDLWRGADDGATAQIVEIDAGSSFNTLDVHQGAEEILVISGVFGDGAREYLAGSFIHNPAGSSHVPQSKDGCVIFVFSPQR
ncbi:MAG: cupin domain-containing protein [Chthoniobacterales bacterium]